MQIIRHKGTHRFLFFGFVFLSTLYNVLAQTTITIADMPQLGENYVVRTASVPASLNLKGDDFFDESTDYNQFKTLRSDTLRVTDASKTRYFKFFPASQTTIISSAPIFTYNSVVGASVYENGFISDYLNIQTPAMVLYKRPVKRMQLPLLYGSASTDTAQGKIITPYQLLPGIDSVRAQITIIYKSRVDSVGTVKTPFGTYESLRVKQTQTIEVRAMKFSPRFGWTPSPEFSRKEIKRQYIWYAPKMGVPVLVATADRYGIITQVSYQYNEKLKYDFWKRNVACKGGNDGYIEIVVKGGVPDYSVAWVHGVTGGELKGLKAGLYRYSITDNKKTKIMGEVYIAEPDKELLVTENTQNITCAGSFNGSSELIVSGGTKPYIIKWGYGPGGALIENLRASVYNYTVTDAHQCFVEDSVQITQPDYELSLELESEFIACHGDSTGSLAAYARGGTKPYSYLWSNGDTSQINRKLKTGEYQITVTDAMGCTVTKRKTVKQPSEPLLAKMQPTHINCYNANNGQITVQVSGGRPSYNYLWSNGSTERRLRNVSPGNYGLVLTDKYGCKLSLKSKLTQPQSPLALRTNRNNVTCKGAHDGRIESFVTGGTQPYTTLWSNNRNSLLVEGLAPNEYEVTITDQNGCELDSAFVITEPENTFEVNYESGNVHCFGDSTGFIHASLFGGKKPYTATWTDGSTELKRNQLLAGKYSLQVNDRNNCKLSKTIELFQPSNSLVLHANESQSQCYGDYEGAIQLVASGGTVDYEFTIRNNVVDNNLDGLKDGNYPVQVTDANGCTKHDTIIIKSPPALMAHSNVTSAEPNKANGMAELCVFGGTKPYNYNWSNGKTEQGIYLQKNNDFQVVITDAHTCVLELELKIEQCAFGIYEFIPGVSAIQLYGKREAGQFCKKAIPDFVVIYNFMGRRVAVQRLNDRAWEIGQVVLPAGYYMYQVYSQGNLLTYKSAFYVK